MARIAARFMLHTKTVGLGDQETRRRSAALFGNEKVAEVVLALEANHGFARLTDVSVTAGIVHSMVRPVLARLVEGGVLVALPRERGRRGEQFFEVQRGAAWSALLQLSRECVPAEAPQLGP